MSDKKIQLKRRFYILSFLCEYFNFTKLALAENSENISGNSIHQTVDGQIQNNTTNRTLKLRIRLPLEKKKSPLIIYSPGLGSGISNGESWCNAWQASGYVVVTISHPMTNDDIWDTHGTTFIKKLQTSIAPPQYDLRVNDCKFVITELLKGSHSKLLNEGLHLDYENNLENYIDANRIGIAGHSYGALTVQSICGQGDTYNRDPRIKAAIAFSPGSLTEASAKKMMAVKIPFFCVMGNHDNHVTFTKNLDKMTLGMPLEKRKKVFDYLPKGKRQLWIVSDADHMTFAGEKINSTQFSRDIPINDTLEKSTWHRINEITTSFWDYHLQLDHKMPLNDYKKQLGNNILQNEISEIDLAEYSTPLQNK